MFDKTYYATHPDMMECVSNEELRDRYLIGGLFRDGECVLNYTHAERFVIGGVAVVDAPVKLGASLTVRMKDCEASVPTPLEALKVRL